MAWRDLQTAITTRNSNANASDIGHPRVPTHPGRTDHNVNAQRREQADRRPADTHDHAIVAPSTSSSRLTQNVNVHVSEQHDVHSIAGE